MTDSDVLSKITWPTPLTVQTLGNEIASVAGFERLVINPMPADLNVRGLSGITVSSRGTAKVFYARSLSPLNRKQTILHEFAHILHGDLGLDEGRTIHRTAFDDPRERRAEETGMLLLAHMHKLQTQQQSALVDFISRGR